MSVWLSFAAFSKLIVIYLCSQQPFSAVLLEEMECPSADSYINNAIDGHRGILPNLRIAGSPVTCNSMDEPWWRYTSHTKTNIKFHIYDLFDQQEIMLLTNRACRWEARAEEISSLCLMDIHVQFCRMKRPGDLTVIKMINFYCVCLPQLKTERGTVGWTQELIRS